MEELGRVRFVNTMLLAGFLLIYVVYDTVFRFWISKNDSVALNAAILHDTAALKAGGESGLTFEAAAEVTSTPPLQSYLSEAQRWLLERSSPTDHNSHRFRHTDKKMNIAAADMEPSYAQTCTTALLDFPMAAVVVESTWLSPGQAAVSAAYAQRLLEGFRYSLLTGAPWLLLVGSVEETALGLQYLRRMSDPAETLFGRTVPARWPRELRRVAESIRASMEPYATLDSWMHGAASMSIPTFGSASLHARSPSAALRVSLSYLLSVSALADAEGSTQHSRQSTLILAAEWLSRLNSSGDENTNNNGEDAAVPLGGAKGPRVTLYATEEASTEKRQKELRYSGSDHSDEVAWESPRVVEWLLSGTAQRVHLTVPGMVAIAVPDANKRARYAAKALQQLLETTLVRRHAQRANAPLKESKSLSGWWWWLGRPYGVTIVGGGWEQQRVKLLYMKALREAAATTQESLRRAVQYVHRARCQFEGVNSTSSLYCGDATRQAQLPNSALPFTAAVPSPPKVFVLPPALEVTPTPEPQPRWLNYTGELPLSVNTDASYAAQVIGRWSYFIYVNYRLWMDWLLASLPAGAYQDHLVLATVLISDLADHRISWRDVLYTR